LIIEALKRSRIKSLNEAFSLIDKEQRGYISKDDFKDIFRNLGVK
jgi:Ca2+-binding EF-hand superfamily protein